jgi:hypothetical protein
MNRKNLYRANFINDKLEKLEEVKHTLDTFLCQKKTDDGFFSYCYPFPICLKHKDVEISIDDSIEGKIMKDLILDYINNQIKILEDELLLL